MLQKIARPVARQADRLAAALAPVDDLLEVSLQFAYGHETTASLTSFRKGGYYKHYKQRYATNLIRRIAIAIDQRFKTVEGLPHTIEVIPLDSEALTVRTYLGRVKKER